MNQPSDGMSMSIEWPGFLSREHAQGCAGVRALLVDFDGVLIDSEYANFLAWQEEFVRHGAGLALEEWAEHWAANTADPAHKTSTLDMLLQRAAGPLDEAAAESRRRARYEHLVAGLPARRGLVGWVRQAHAAGLRSMVVTNADAARVHAALARLGVADALTVVQGRTRGLSPKPAPDLYLAALDRLGATADEALAVEDSPHGIRAAVAAGLRCVAVPNRVTACLDLGRVDLVVPDPEALPLAEVLRRLRAPSPVAPGPSAHARPRGEQETWRIWGSLSALALGDAIGKLIDKRPADRLDAPTRLVLDRVGAHTSPPESFVGRVTDDTILTLALIDVLLAGTGGVRTRYEARLREIDPRGGKQIYKLKASRDPLYVSGDGATNGCVPRSAAFAYTYAPACLGDLCYAVLKVATLTHGHPDALMAALLLAVCLTHAVAGDTPAQVREALPALRPSLEAVAGGGQAVGEALARCLAVAEQHVSLADYVDHLEETVGMAVQARSSAVVGISLALVGHPFHATLPVLLRRRRERWDLDSTAAIYGALAGAFQPETVPAGWVFTVERFTSRSFDALAELLHRRRALATPEQDRRP